MTHQRDEVLRLSSDRQWRALSSPVRLEMVVGLVVIGPCSVRQLAEQLDRPADGLYHHLRLLVAAGLAVVVEQRKVGRKLEAIYDVVAHDIGIDTDISTPKRQQRVIRITRLVLQQARRQMEAAIGAGKVVLRGTERTASLDLVTAWLDEERLDKVRKHQEAIYQIMQEGVKQKQGRLFSVLLFMSPVVRRRGAKRKKASETKPKPTKEQ